MKRAILLASAVTVGLIVSALGSFAGPQATSKASPKDQAPPPATKANNTKGANSAPAAAPIVTEISDLVLAPKSKGTGVVTITSQGDDCASVKLEGQVEVGPNYDGGNNFSGVMFLPGVKHKFIGPVCLFTVGTDVKMSGGIQGKVNYGERADLFRVCQEINGSTSW